MFITCNYIQREVQTLHLANNDKIIYSVSLLNLSPPPQKMELEIDNFVQNCNSGSLLQHKIPFSEIIEFTYLLIITTLRLSSSLPTITEDLF